MALHPVPIATKDAEHSAQQFRMMIKDLARGNQGVTTGLDMKVSALSTPGAGVQISDGSAVIAGVVSTVQGYYNAYNIGTDTVDVSATGGVSRSDMLVLRVEDPEYEGTRDPATDPIVFFEVIPNVSSSATTVPSGYSAIPLARIDIPASTATITNAMITDLRKVANPRRERTLYQHFYPGPLVEKTGTSTTYTAFPTSANWSIAVPVWANRVKIVMTVAGVRFSTGFVVGGFTFQFGTKFAAQNVNIDDDQSTGIRRTTLMTSDSLSLTDTAGAAMRGTTVTLKTMFRTATNNAGNIGIDGATTFIADVEFEEGAL
jgi:hypothetical protein